MSPLLPALPAATAAAPLAAAQPAGGGTSLFMLLMFAALAVLMFLSFRRAKKVQTQQAEMRRGLTPGQQVMLTSGIYGTVVAMDEADQRTTLEIAPGVRMDVHPQGIASVVEPTAAETVAGPTVTESATAGSTVAAPVAEPVAEPRVADADPVYGRPDVVDPGQDGPTPRTDRA